MLKLKVGDEVMVIAGRDKGKRGEVLRFLSGNRCVVAGVCLVKKHQKTDPNRQIAGGIIEKELGIHRSNVQLWNKKTSRPESVAIRIEDGKKCRVFRSGHPV